MRAYGCRWLGWVSIAGVMLLGGCGEDEATTADGGAPDAAPSDAARDADLADGLPPDMAPDGGPTDPAFVFEGAEPAECPLSAADCDAHWPADGAVSRWTSTEHFGEVQHPRSAWFYRPPNAEGDVPLLIFLHGGNGSGPAMFERRFDELARGEEVTWSAATAGCVYTYPTGFRTPGGERCRPEMRSARSEAPFALLLPDGIRSVSTRIPDARHWEDGRSPSPGQLVEPQTRDDVGYIAHLVEAAITRGGVDPERVVLAGWSNGGMMTLRVLCEREAPGRAPLRRLAAVAVGVASLPANLYDGAAGRPRCPRAMQDPPAVYIQVGRGIPTPDCEAYPCDMPVADGDGRMPYGSPGSQHNVYSPDLGRIQAFDDTRTLLEGALGAAYGADGPATADALGAFTAREVTTFGGDRVELRVLVTEGGAHEAGGARLEWQSEARQWHFLGGFMRRDGAVQRRAVPAVSGDF